MTKPNRFDRQEGVIIHSKAFVRTQVLRVKSKCYIVLRQSAIAPHVLEKYDSAHSTSGTVIILKNVIVNPSHRKGFEIILYGTVMHHFILKSEEEAAKWIQHLHRFCCFEPLNSNVQGQPAVLSVNLLPSTSLHYQGQCHFVATEMSISLFYADSRSQCIVSWPLRAIRSYGINRKMFTLKTGRACETGRAEFIFETSKPLTPFHVYQEVASKLYRSSAMNQGSVIAAYSEMEPYNEVELPLDQDGGSHIYETFICAPEMEQHQPYDLLPDIVIPEDPNWYSMQPFGWVTYQLPSKSFQSIFGLNSCVSQLKKLITRNVTSKICRLMLYGPPKAGKEALANALAAEFQAQFVCTNCLSLSRTFHRECLEDLRKEFTHILSLTPCVFLINNIDVIPDEFSDVRTGHAVLEVLRVLLDSLPSTDHKMIVIISSCFPQKVDSDLVTQVEEKIYVPLPSQPTRLRIIESILGREAPIEADTFWQSVAARTSGFSVDELSVLCGKMAECTSAERTVEETLSEHLLERCDDVMCGDSIYLSAQYFIWDNNLKDTFVVILETNSALPNTDVCILTVSSTDLELRDPDFFHEIVRWSRKTIRGFGSSEKLFQIETGRSSQTGAAVFSFRTSEGQAIQKLILDTRDDH